MGWYLVNDAGTRIPVERLQGEMLVIETPDALVFPDFVALRAELPIPVIVKRRGAEVKCYSGKTIVLDQNALDAEVMKKLTDGAPKHGYLVIVKRPGTDVHVEP